MNMARESINRETSEEKDASIVVFADDNTPMQSARTLEELEDTLQYKADIIANWFKKNKMVVSGDKTKLLVVKTKAARNNLVSQEIQITVDGGVVVNNVATWKNRLYGDSDNLILA